MRKYDFYIKTIEGVQERTNIGGLITLLSTIFAFVLVCVEIYTYFAGDYVSHMSIDASLPSVKGINGVEVIGVKFNDFFFNFIN